MAYLTICHFISPIDCCYNWFEYVKYYIILCLLRQMTLLSMVYIVLCMFVMLWFLVKLFCWSDDVCVVVQDPVVGGYAAG